MTEGEGAALRWRGEPPRLTAPVMVAAFLGWPDAAEVATRAMRQLIESLGARRVADIDPEEFYIFTEARPRSVQLTPGERHLEWPRNDFYVWRDDTHSLPHTVAGNIRCGDLVLLLAREPNLRWRTYAGNIITAAMRLGVGLLVTLGGTYDSVLHTDPPLVTGSGSTPDLRARLGRLGAQSSGYQGPTSVQTALQLAFAERGLPAASLWGHAPHYVQGYANTRVAAGIVRSLGDLLGKQFDTAPLDAAALSLDRRVDRLLAQDSDLRNYVARLKSRLARDHAPTDTPSPDSIPADGAELPSADAVVEQLEEFLRRQQQPPPDESRG